MRPTTNKKNLLAPYLLHVYEVLILILKSSGKNFVHTSKEPFPNWCSMIKMNWAKDRTEMNATSYLRTSIRAQNQVNDFPVMFLNFQCNERFVDAHDQIMRAISASQCGSDIVSQFIFNTHKHNYKCVLCVCVSIYIYHSPFPYIHVYIIFKIANSNWWAMYANTHCLFELNMIILCFWDFRRASARSCACVHLHRFVVIHYFRTGISHRCRNCCARGFCHDLRLSFSLIQ